jgi:hypothetical protein
VPPRKDRPAPTCPDQSAEANRALDNLLRNPCEATASYVVRVINESRCDTCRLFHIDGATYMRWIAARLGHDAVGDALSLAMFGALT